MNHSGTAVSTSVRITQYWIPVLVMLIIQFGFSTDSFSSDETSRYIGPVLKFLMPHLTADGVDFWHHVIRKAAHITEYTILGILVYRAFQLDVENPVSVRILTLLFVATAASMDEFHQSFVPSRTSSIFDVGFDCIGGMIALALTWVWGISRTAQE